MCIVIFYGIKPNEMVETGMDLMAETIGNATDDDFFGKTMAREKKFRAVPRANSKVNRLLVFTDGAGRDNSQQRL